jgi:hypothetical protein
VDALGGGQIGQPDPDNGQLLPGRDRRGHRCLSRVQAVARVSRHDGQQPVKLIDDFRVRGRRQRDAVPFGRSDPLARDSQEVTSVGVIATRQKLVDPPRCRGGIVAGPTILRRHRHNGGVGEAGGQDDCRRGDRVRYLVRIRARCRRAGSVASDPRGQRVRCEDRVPAVSGRHRGRHEGGKRSGDRSSYRRASCRIASKVSNASPSASRRSASGLRPVITSPSIPGLAVARVRGLLRCQADGRGDAVQVLVRKPVAVAA